MKEVGKLFGISVFKSRFFASTKVVVITDEDFERLKKAEASVFSAFRATLQNLYQIETEAQVGALVGATEKPAPVESRGPDAAQAAGGIQNETPDPAAKPAGERVGRIISLKGHAGGSGASRIGE